MRLAWLMVAGALGAAARYGITLAAQGWLGHRQPRDSAAAIVGCPPATLIINVSGALLLSFLMTLAAHKWLTADLRIILGTGFLGAFTTFSTFEFESEQLLSSGAWIPAAGYIFGNLLLGFIAILLGRLLASRLVGA